LVESGDFDLSNTLAGSAEIAASSTIRVLPPIGGNTTQRILAQLSAPALAGIAAIATLLFLLLLLKRKKEEEIPTDGDAEDGDEHLTEEDFTTMTGDNEIFVSEYGLSDEILSDVSEKLPELPELDPVEFERGFAAVSECSLSEAEHQSDESNDNLLRSDPGDDDLPESGPGDDEGSAPFSRP
jgi:hypothetical protein